LKRSTERILTTHVGSIPRPPEVLELMRLKESGQPYDQKELDVRVRAAVATVVRRQAEVGIDVPSDGEFSKSSFSAYANERLSGFQLKEGVPSVTGRGRDRTAFADFYLEYEGPAATSSVVCTAPVRYIGQALVQRDIENFTAALQGLPLEEAFIPAVAPGTMALQRRNQYYRTDEEYIFAVADALKEEYRAIVDAGFILQIDDPRLVTQYDTMDPEPSIEEYRKFAALRIEALNGALAGLPEDRVRYHVCWGSWHGPHTTDIPFEHLIDLVLGIRAGAWSFEAANPRHEHEWTLWETVKLPEGKSIIPGVIAHTTNHVEHPELVAQRLVNFARLVGRENIIAGVDCGFSQSVFTQRAHPSVMWAKFRALADGARIASQQLWQ